RSQVAPDIIDGRAIMQIIAVKRLCNQLCQFQHGSLCRHLYAEGHHPAEDPDRFLIFLAATWVSYTDHKLAFVAGRCEKPGAQSQQHVAGTSILRRALSSETLKVGKADFPAQQWPASGSCAFVFSLVE